MIARQLAACALASLLGCSGTSGSSPAASSGEDGGAAEASTSWPGPASHAAMPHVVDYGGPVLASPQVQPVVFAGDAMQQDIAAFTGGLGHSSYWAAMASEYGVGALRSLPVVVVSEAAPSAPSDAQVQSWLAAKIAAGQLPAPDGNIVYAVYYPATTVITSREGTSCTDFYGYHDQGVSQAGVAYPYAVLPRCHDSIHADLDNVTNFTAHELLEAATDPYLTTRPAYATVDADHAVWTLVAGGESELADMCQLMPGAAYIRPSDLPYAVPRSWSNAAAAASHDPCVPAPTGAYFNAAPVLPDAVTIPVGSSSLTTQAVKIPLGQSRTIEVQLYSDAPTSDPWKVEALDVATLQGKPALLKLSLDASTGSNGDVLHLTITPLQQGTGGLESFYVGSALQGRSSLWVGLVSND